MVIGGGQKLVGCNELETCGKFNSFGRVANIPRAATLYGNSFRWLGVLVRHNG